ncbi:MAG: NERD domain-containing protein, partial [Clostridia bacterium]|nr:NERD domain-containing protein [Clostridia bacterium]
GERNAELDLTVVNKYGVFVIEVKNYSGVLYGGKDDRKWTKKHVSRGGRVFVKPVTNPLRQVKREVDILARYLRYHGFDVWVEGYAFICGAESPVRSERIIEDARDADRALHTPGRRRLTNAEIKGIREFLEQQAR